MKSLYYLILLIFLSCYPADPEYALKPMLNTSDSGFISRDFFQVIIQASPPMGDYSIERERIECKKNALIERDKQTIQILKKILSEKDNKWKNDLSNKNVLKLDSLTTSTDKQASIELSDTSINRGEFSWMLDRLKVYMEDYSEKNKCKFVFRAIEKGLYEKLEATRLSRGTIPSNN